jgi:hypothetical protein
MAKRPMPVDYAGPEHPETSSGRGAEALGAAAFVLALLPLLPFISLQHNRGNPFGVALLIPLVFWGAVNVLGLVLGAIGWWRARSSPNRRGYVMCVCANLLNWLGIGALAYVFFFT